MYCLPRCFQQKALSRMILSAPKIGQYSTLSFSTKKTTKYERNDSAKSGEELMRKEKQLTRFLVDCNLSQREDSGFSTFLNARSQGYSYNKNEVYHILMENYAKQGKFEKLSQIYDISIEDNVPPNFQTFALIFECFGRMPVNELNSKLLEKFVEEAGRNKISFNDIMDRSVFTKDQRELVLAVIRRFSKNFTPKYEKPHLNYTNRLLEHLNDSSTAECTEPILETPELRKLSQQQLDLEFKKYVNLNDCSILDPVEPFNSGNADALMNDLYKEWHTNFLAAFIKNAERLRMSSNENDRNLSARLDILEPTVYANIIVDEIKILLQRHGSHQLIVGFYQYDLGEKVHLYIDHEMRQSAGVLQKSENLYHEYCENLYSSRENCRQKWQILDYSHKHHGPSLDTCYSNWSNKEKSAIGRHLYMIAGKTIKIDENYVMGIQKNPNKKPVLNTIRAKKDSDLYFKINPILLDLFKRANEPRQLKTKQLPMLCPPIPWTNLNSGGYLITRNDFIRSLNPSDQFLRISEKPVTHIYPMLDALNERSNIPWRVNTRLLDVAVEVYNVIKVEKWMKLQHREKKIDLYTWRKERAPKTKLTDLKVKMKVTAGEICDKLLVANHFRNNMIWLPHNTDFRGRVYPIPQILDYTATDINRSLLIFHERKPLGADGLKWLKIHCVNLKGNMKLNSLQERLDYAEKSINEILDSADNPINGNNWWVDSKEPWQTLACCMEIADAVRSTDPTQYRSGLPVQQDGTCNNLQHYAALTRNTLLANSVNLGASQRPQDAYTKVVDIVEKLRTEDAKNGVEVANLLNGYIKREVLKQPITVMIYGGGVDKAQEALKRVLRTLPNFPKEAVEPGAVYLEQKQRSSLPEVLEGVEQAQVWLKHCASHVTETYKQNMEWVTPLDWPVVHPYLTDAFNYEESSMKNISAFAPNFIHSLESSHMILTALNCRKAGITFISEHDSFGTHACSVPEMNEICRKQFILLYSQPILRQLASSLGEKFSRNVDIFQQHPELGDFDLREVLKSTYFFN